MGEGDQQQDGQGDAELVRELRAGLKSVWFSVFLCHGHSLLSFLSYRKAHESQKEMKLLLDVYKGLAKEQREKVEVKFDCVNQCIALRFPECPMQCFRITCFGRM